MRDTTDMNARDAWAAMVAADAEERRQRIRRERLRLSLFLVGAAMVALFALAQLIEWMTEA